MKLNDKQAWALWHAAMESKRFDGMVSVLVANEPAPHPTDRDKAKQKAELLRSMADAISPNI